MVRLHGQERLHLQQPQNVFFDQIQKMFGGKRQISPGATVSAAANQAQIAAAVTDATCTESADLAGIYFAVQASYEQQIVNANQPRRSPPRSSSTRPPTPRNSRSSRPC